MKQWFKLKFALFGAALGLIAILFSEKNTQGTPQAVSLMGDFSKWFITVPGKVIAIFVAFLFIRNLFLLWKESDEKKEAVKTIAKNLAICIVTILAIGMIIGLVQVWLPKS